MQRAEKMKGWLARARGDVQPESEEYGCGSRDYLFVCSVFNVLADMEFLRSSIARGGRSIRPACTLL